MNAPEKVAALLADVVRREGGYGDHPADGGGATQYGISLRYARGLGLDLDGDGDTDQDDIRLVTPEGAMALYRRDFFEGPGFHRLPAPLWPALLDWAVTSGPARPILALQRVLNCLGRLDPQTVRRPEPLTEDGRLGPQTRRAAEAAVAGVGAPVLINALCDERASFVRTLVAQHPSQRVFLKGWLARIDSLREKETIS